MKKFDFNYKAMVVRESANNFFTKKVELLSTNDLSDGEVLIRVHFSSVNYKDALSCSGHRGVTRHYPHTPGIDAAGVVEYSYSDDFEKGDNVVVISYGLGENTSGGFGQFISVPSSWVMLLPNNMSLYESMIFGTAGFTAALAVHKLQNIGISPNDGKIIVTGASGGVGSISVALLSSLGYSVTASTGKKGVENFLKNLGAREVIDRNTLSSKSKMTLLREEWIGAIDNIGGNTLINLLKSCKPNGAVVSIGIIDSAEIETTIFPFIMRGINLLGISASLTKMDNRKKIWDRLANDWKPQNLNELVKECSLENLSVEIDKILEGSQVGRVVVDMR
jgi:acrylyl-CoA reductase (NADPH)